MSDKSARRTVKAAGGMWLGLGALVVAVAAGGLWRSNVRQPAVEFIASESQRPLDMEGLRPEIDKFCGACHVVPSAGYAAKDMWHREVEQGFDLYEQSGRIDLEVPRFMDVVEFFRRQAPEELTWLDDGPETPGNVRFRPLKIPFTSPTGQPAVSHIQWLELVPGSGRQLVFCDMSIGGVLTYHPGRDGERVTPLGSFWYPCHVTPCDLDGDGVLDFVVGELGRWLAEDHELGRVMWLHQRDAGAPGGGKTSEWETILLQDKLGRVADIQPADFDGDGDQDLVVAEFGWRTTGHILLFENQGLTDGRPEFEVRTIDERHGTIHVPVTDLNGDGRPDFVALISQEHETIVAFLNEGHGQFRKETIMPSRDPAYGSSGIQLVDLDRDGDLDVLYTNGDNFDRKYLKPFHSVQWLENRGGYPYVWHPVTNLPGVHRALAGDLDGDDDLDIVAVTYLPERVISRQSPQRKLSAVIWLEQTSPGEFVRHRLEDGTCHHATCELVDVDGDNDLDIVVGQFAERSTEPQPWLTIWINEGH